MQQNLRRALTHITHPEYAPAQNPSPLTNPGQAARQHAYTDPRTPEPGRIQQMQYGAQAWLQHLNYSIRQEIFSLSPAQEAILQEIIQDHPMRAEIESVLHELNGQVAYAINTPYPMSDCLRIIASLPDEPTEGWERRWTEGRQLMKSWSVPNPPHPNRLRQPDGAPLKMDPATQAMLETARAIGQAAARRQPDPAAVAANISENQEPATPVSLAQVLGVCANIAADLNQFQTEPPNHPAAILFDPEQVAKLLQESGFQIQIDAASLGYTPPMQRPLLQPLLQEDVKIHANPYFWYAAEHPATTMLSMQHEVRIPPPAPTNLEAYVRLAAPKLPEDRFIAQQAVARIAKHSRTTPNALYAYLRGESESWQPDPLPQPCPVRKRCPAECSRLQREDIIPFPITPGGSAAECKLYPLIASHGHLDPENQEAAAKHRLQQFLQEGPGRDQPAENDRPDQTAKPAASPPAAQRALL